MARISFKIENPGVVIVEILRYAEIIRVTGMGHTGNVSYEVIREMGPLNDNEVIVTMDCPEGLSPSVWVDQNVKRLRSFGIKVVVWKSGCFGSL